MNEFPWHYLEDPTDASVDDVVRWIYAGFAGRAYEGYLRHGRGLLVGPFLTDEGRNLIDRTDFIERRRNSIETGLVVIFVAADSPAFETTLPDARLREQLRQAIESYDPERECIILLLDNNTPRIARIAGANAPIVLPMLDSLESSSVQ